MSGPVLLQGGAGGKQLIHWLCWAPVPQPPEKTSAFPAPPSLEVFQERPDTDHN